jgi:cytidine deaminase
VAAAPVSANVRGRLLAGARAVRRRAHAPYSRYHVGAAVLDERGRIHVGCNVENASYGLTVCAERNAVGAAVAAGARHLSAVAVVTAAAPPGEAPAPPCGACRQVLAELAPDDAIVLLAGPRGPATELTLGALLPRAFRLRR